MLISKERFPIKDIVLYGFLPSLLKKFVYRLKGYRIGKGVSIGPGSVIVGEDVSIGDHTSIGFLSILRGKTIKLGSHVSIGSATILDTPHMEIGEGTKINEQVFAGGLQFPDSRLTIGRNCQIMQMSFLNPTKSITIGDDSGIGGDCLLFGHTSWLSRFEGYPVEFAPIEIGKSVSLAWRVFALPGTTIGDGAVIGANSLVRGAIPPRCLAIGFPARVVSKFPEFPRDVGSDEKVSILRDIVGEMVAFFSGSGIACHGLQDDMFEVKAMRRTLWGRKAHTYTLKVCYETPSPEDVRSDGRFPNVLLSLSVVPGETRRICKDHQVMWIDIENKEQPVYCNDLGEEVLLFLRRYGVRFYRVND